MLEGLVGPDWGGLRHAYGPADDLPGLIRAAASPDEAEADWAVDELFHSVCHQGLTVYPASVAAVPLSRSWRPQRRCTSGRRCCTCWAPWPTPMPRTPWRWPRSGRP